MRWSGMDVNQFSDAPLLGLQLAIASACKQATRNDENLGGRIIHMGHFIQIMWYPCIPLPRLCVAWMAVEGGPKCDSHGREKRAGEQGQVHLLFARLGAL